MFDKIMKAAGAELQDVSFDPTAWVDRQWLETTFNFTVASWYTYDGEYTEYEYAGRDYVPFIVGFKTTDGREYVVTYADGYGFEFVCVEHFNDMPIIPEAGDQWDLTEIIARPNRKAYSCCN